MSLGGSEQWTLGNTFINKERKKCNSPPGEIVKSLSQEDFRKEADSHTRLPESVRKSQSFLKTRCTNKITPEEPFRLFSLILFEGHMPSCRTTHRPGAFPLD